MTDLFIDIGNTNTKIKYQQKLILIPTKGKYDIASFYALLPLEVQKSKLTNVWICSVATKMLILVQKMLNTYFPNVIIHQIDRHIFPALKLNVKNPDKVGHDLIALGAFATKQNDNVIIVNLGTATTISQIKNMTFQGVIIAPGLAISLDSLINQASALSSMPWHLKLKQALGHDTNEAISLGILKGHALMIEGFIKSIDPQAKVIISGGNAEKIIHYLPKYQYVSEATLLGVEIIAKAQIDK